MLEKFFSTDGAEPTEGFTFIKLPFYTDKEILTKKIVPMLSFIARKGYDSEDGDNPTEIGGGILLLEHLCKAEVFNCKPERNE